MDSKPERKMCGILIVDDDASIRFAMADYFSAKGHRTRSVASRDECDAALADAHYGIVITDLCLGPAGDDEGLEIVRTVCERHRGTLCIVLTAYGSPDSEAAARRDGASAFLHKPRPMAELLDLVARLLPADGHCVAAITERDERERADVLQLRDGALSPRPAQTTAAHEPTFEEPSMPYQISDEVIEQIWHDLAEQVAKPRVAEVAREVANSFGDVKVTTFAPLFVRRLSVDRLRPEAAQRV